MRVSSFRRGGLWRQATSLVVAYAFALHVALFGFAAAQSAGLTDPGALDVALCLHDDGTTPSLPAQEPGGAEHCKLCTLGGYPLLVAPAIAPHAVIAAPDNAPRLATDWFIPSVFQHASARPRGPPPA